MPHLVRHLEEDLITRCCVPSGCLHNIVQGGDTISLDDLENTVKVICNNEQCDFGQYMHNDCFMSWEASVLTFLKSCGRARSWSEKQRLQNLWTKKGYDLAYKACGCQCSRGHIRKDLNWNPPKSDDAAKKKKKQQKAAVAPPSMAKKNEILAAVRNRANSLSSTGSTGSSASSGSGDSPNLDSTSPNNSFTTSFRRPSKGKSDFGGIEKSRNLSGGLFVRRPDFSSFNVLPKHKINSYHIKLEDETNHSNDETRNFILTSLAANKMSHVHCLLCATSLTVYDRFPLVDGTFFLSPRQHTKSCIKVNYEGKDEFLGALCMACLEGWTARLKCRWCSVPWDGSMLLLGTMYAYDVFAAAPCCYERLKTVFQVNSILRTANVLMDTDFDILSEIRDNFKNCERASERPPK
ncbi:hypothetical protein QYM36_010537 [Artemia franciscana]|uniref:Headcase middle domain-containing protein n=1 Tax=Artemia franciscana TaxID=6661 RepID=A0AA88HRZ0_ARTSF|nr:hypothetical protein QYM36_010537 [Artemia franciscana]